METLYFITANGVCGYRVEWDGKETEIYAHDWVDEWGEKLGVGSAPLPMGGYIDLRQFAVISQTR